MSGAGGKEAAAAVEKIAVQAKVAERSLRDVGTAAGQSAGGVKLLDSAFSSLGATVVGFVAAGAIANWLKDAYIGFARTERQALVVENQIKSLGQAAQGAGFRDFIAQLSQTSGILDDDLIPAFQRGLIAFRDFEATQDAITIAARFAAAGLGDVGSNMLALTTFFQTGQARALKPFISDVKGAADGTISWAEVLPQLQRSLEDIGQPLNDAQAKIDSVKVGMDFLADSTGAVEEAFINLAMRGIKPVLQVLSFTAGEVGVAASAMLKGLEDAAEKGEQARIDAFFNGADKLDALNRVNTARQAERDKADAQKSSDETVKAEAAALEKIKSLNESNSQALISEVLSQYEVGTNERLNLEIALNEKIRAAAIENAQKIGADTALINTLFDEKARKAREAFANESGSLPAAGSGGPDPEIQAAIDKADEIVRIEQDEADRIHAIQLQKTQWAVDSAQMQTDAVIEAGSQTGHALAQIFNKHKGFAIGMAIMDTASAIMQIWAAADGSPWYVKLVKSLAMAAIGAAQISSIRSAGVDGSGSTVSGGGGAGNAASPTFARTGTPDAPSAFTPGDGGTSVSGMSSTQAAILSGRSQSGSGPTVVVQIKNAFGDKRSMMKLTREVTRVVRDNPSVLR